jgi:hypothetical protein
VPTQGSVHVLKSYFIGILVRNEATVKKLKEKLGDIGMIM